MILISMIRYQCSDINYIKYMMSSIIYNLSYIKYQISGDIYRVSGIRYQNTFGTILKQKVGTQDIVYQKLFFHHTHYIFVTHNKENLNNEDIWYQYCHEGPNLLQHSLTKISQVITCQMSS